MSTRKKKTAQTHRKVCCCEAFQCNVGSYVDASGNNQPGVELTREAYEAHRRVEIRNRARATLSPSTSSSRTPPQTPPRLNRDVSTSQTDITSPLARMTLNQSEEENLRTRPPHSHPLGPAQREVVSCLLHHSDEDDVEAGDLEGDSGSGNILE
ncbi:uncharacterized protein MELLADRAFT_113733 [Melampsora larici-populina 98AG31]|uniref:Uncharacterized protein n=1 Tax=Melampsora larici-populina (strain 98AG31 / pathotype 3-4-7) TaxID=747676 RepID=F4SAW6_MELLP|nr:uncharacterized protein MELLADRAFT_113733 [Melampsora larici-populina 98AG31]EGF98213.1 hypothetical protein MELLADRAFT_113733 [Melampsora larici-populina 98AG31]